MYIVRYKMFVAIIEKSAPCLNTLEQILRELTCGDCRIVSVSNTRGSSNG